MISSSNPISKMPALFFVAIGLLTYAPVESNDVSAIQQSNNCFSIYTTVDLIDSITNSNESTGKNNSFNFKVYLSDIDALSHGDNFLSSTYIETEEQQVIDHRNEVFDNLLNQFIVLLKEDDDNSYNASEFLSMHYNLNRPVCIKIIQTAFRKAKYIYAKDVITAVRFSDINYFQPWFKDLLEEGLTHPHLKNYINNFLNLYKETFDSL